ncbi:MAG: hypothetical protein RLZZ543_556 [Bacteroidota bacterium]|jgi:hypothetical protein
MRVNTSRIITVSFRFIFPLLLFWAGWTAFKSYSNQSAHENLLQLDQKAQIYLNAGDRFHALQLINQLHHPSTDIARGVATSENQSWQELWDIRREALLQQALRIDSVSK